MKKTIPKLRAARKSVSVWLLTAGLALAEVLPHVIESLPMAREAFGDVTYQYILRAVFVLSIAVRVARLKVGDRDE